MKQFTPLLKRLDEKLNLPQPDKSRIILEIATDLDDLYRFYRDKGFDEQEAILRAEEKIALSDAALTELTEIHKSRYSKWMEKISERTRARWEKFLLLFTALTISYFTIQLIAMPPFFRQASTLVLPSLVIFAVFLALVTVKFFQLYLQKDHRIKKLNRYMTTIQFLGILNLFLGMFGYVFELFRSSGKGLMMLYNLLILITTDSIESTRILTETAGAIMKSASIAMICIFVTVASGVIWFQLNHKIAKVEQAAAFSLLNE